MATPCGRTARAARLAGDGSFSSARPGSIRARSATAAGTITAISFERSPARVAHPEAIARARPPDFAARASRRSAAITKSPHSRSGRPEIQATAST